MPPFIKNNVSDLLDDVPDLEPIVDLKQLKSTDDVDDTKTYKLQIVWRNVILMSLLHISAVYGAILCFTSAKWQTSVLGEYFLLSLCFFLPQFRLERCRLLVF